MGYILQRDLAHLFLSVNSVDSSKSLDRKRLCTVVLVHHSFLMSHRHPPPHDLFVAFVSLSALNTLKPSIEMWLSAILLLSHVSVIAIAEAFL